MNKALVCEITGGQEPEARVAGIIFGLVSLCREPGI
jgi:hypothetical protein